MASYIPFRIAIDNLREKRVLKKLKAMGATSPEKAKSAKEIGLTKQESERLPSLLNKIKSAKPKTIATISLAKKNIAER